MLCIAEGAVGLEAQWRCNRWRGVLSPKSEGGMWRKEQEAKLKGQLSIWTKKKGKTCELMWYIRIEGGGSVDEAWSLIEYWNVGTGAIGSGTEVRFGSKVWKWSWDLTWDRKRSKWNHEEQKNRLTFSTRLSRVMPVAGGGFQLKLKARSLTAVDQIRNWRVWAQRLVELSKLEWNLMAKKEAVVLIRRAKYDRDWGSSKIVKDRGWGLEERRRWMLEVKCWRRLETWRCKIEEREAEDMIVGLSK